MEIPYHKNTALFMQHFENASGVLITVLSQTEICTEMVRTVSFTTKFHSL